jgi:hypothetical protein
MKPTRIVIIDQVNKPELILPAISGLPVPTEVITLHGKMGCEASALNWYLTNVPEERIIAHDDVTFGYYSIKNFVLTPGAFLIDDQQGVISYRDECIQKIGLHDTELSPNYFRYVDVDYEDRLAAVGIEPTVVFAGITHHRDGTMRGMKDLTEYYERVGIAEQNYVKKHGRGLTPGGSTIGRSEWRRSQQCISR